MDAGDDAAADSENVAVAALGGAAVDADVDDDVAAVAMDVGMAVGELPPMWKTVGLGIHTTTQTIEEA